MNALKPVYWHEGLFLRPQHFQQQELYTQQRFQDASQVLQPFSWGVVSMAVKQSRLANQVFELEHAELMFQDGTLASFPANAIVESRSFEDEWPAGSPTLNVYLGLRYLDQNQNNLSDKSSGEISAGLEKFTEKRFLADTSGKLTADLFSADNREEIAFLNFNLQLFFAQEAENAVDFHLIKIAEIERSGNDVRLSADYIPPVVSMQGSGVLTQLVASVNDKLRAKHSELIRYRKDRVQDGAELLQRDMLYVSVLQALSRYIPVLRNFLQVANVPPLQVYQTLIQVVGELSIFSESYDVFGQLESDAEEAVYDHLNLSGSFRHASSVIVNLLDELTAGPDYVATLFFDGTYFSADMDAKLFMGNKQFYLAVKSQLPEDFVVSAITQMSKTSSREVLPLLIARSLSGVEVAFSESPSSKLPRHEGTYYFDIQTLGEAWGAVRDNVNIALYLDNPPADLEVQLMVIDND